MTVHASPLATPAPASRPRLRLPPETRIPLILDAALAAFSAQGYADTRIDDIAQRAGLSKGGLYAHFDSKEAIFHALLQRSMQLPTLDVDAVLAGADTAHELAQRLLQPMCKAVQAPSLMALTRILLTEGTARPRCRTGGATSMPRSALLTQVLQRGVAQGLLRPVLTPVPGLVLEPAGPLDGPAHLGRPEEWVDADEACRIHVQLLTELLAPRAAGSPAPPRLRPGRHTTLGMGGRPHRRRSLRGLWPAGAGGGPVALGLLRAFQPGGGPAAHGLSAGLAHGPGQTAAAAADAADGRDRRAGGLPLGQRLRRGLHPPCGPAPGRYARARRPPTPARDSLPR
jgi:AcrR family transcriptional regulator